MKHKPKQVKVRGVIMIECSRCHRRCGVLEELPGKCKKGKRT